MRRLGSAVTLSSNRYLVSAAARSTLWFHNPERPRGFIRTPRVKLGMQTVAFRPRSEGRIGAQHLHSANGFLEMVQARDPSPRFRARHGDATDIVRPFT